jgi:hypothetical protein
MVTRRRLHPAVAMVCFTLLLSFAAFIIGVASVLVGVAPGDLGSPEVPAARQALGLVLSWAAILGPAVVAGYCTERTSGSVLAATAAGILPTELGFFGSTAAAVYHSVGATPGEAVQIQLSFLLPIVVVLAPFGIGLGATGAVLGTARERRLRAHGRFREPMDSDH